MKIIATIMGQNCEKTLSLCLKSVKDFDGIVYLDGGSTDDSKLIALDYDLTIINNKFDKSNPNMISIQRNYYLNYLKKTYKEELEDVFILVLDADEFVSEGAYEILKNDIKKLKSYTEDGQGLMSNIISPKMRHLIYNLSYEDATRETHFAPNRLFNLKFADKYPKGEHGILNNSGTSYKYSGITIWHLGYLGGPWGIKKRYDQQILRNTGHAKQYLKDWNKAHLLGHYPIKKVNVLDLPKILLENFSLDKDEIYFEGRGIESKHFIDAIDWKEFFKCKTAYEIGCGRGPRVYALNNIGVKTYGCDINKWACEHKFHDNIEQMDITKINSWKNKYDLIIAYDVLEHIEENDLWRVIDYMKFGTRKYILISVPVIGDLNLEADPTHKIKQTKDWWIKKFTDRGFKLIETPQHFLYRNQLMIFEV